MVNKMKKLTKQIIIILSVVLIFVCFDLIIYNVITKRYINDTSEGMIAKSIELDKFLPFEENSEIIKIETDKNVKVKS
jgi:phosphate transport system substrate-binding protein